MEHLNDIGLLIIRLTIGWLFLYPLKLFYNNFREAKIVSGLINEKYATILAILMLTSMLFGGIFIILGIMVRVTAIILFIFSILGIYAHNKLSTVAQNIKTDNYTAHELKNLAISGHSSSSCKNVVILGTCLHLIIVGGGTYCIL